ncbi:MAG: DUF5017 domain-containing protein [Sphingobacterium sp.]|jgi:hypothetical protein|nr:DUF5017 domain-containing protein [Sphingobacterium sp.]
MKKIVLLFQVVVGFFFLSCENAIVVNSPTFDVHVDKLVYKVKDTVRFSFSGDVEYLMFYSGERGAEYEHRLRTKVENAKPILKFENEFKYGPIERRFKLFVLTDFSGIMDADGINNATKHDISDRVNFSPPPGKSGVWFDSGDIDLSDFVKYRQVNLAFQFVTEEMGVGNQGTLTIQNLSLTTYDEKQNAYPVLRELSDGGWLAYSFLGPNRVWRIRPQDLYIGVNPKEPANDDWVITKALDLSSILPDKGVPLKRLTSQLEDYKHVFTKAGEYVVTFVAKNENVYGEKEVLKKLNITIKEEL